MGRDMANFIQRRFTKPETFRKIRPDLLWAWLKQSESYFKSRGVVLPATGENLGADAFSPRLDYDGLVRVFLEPTADMPAELVDGLHLVHEMGRPARVESMFQEACRHGLSLGLGEDATAEDVAVKLLLLDPRVLENLRNCDVMTRRRSFEYFTTDAVPVPRFEGPTLEQIRTLEEKLNSFYVAWRRGGGTRVFAYCQQKVGQNGPEWLFLVRHGGLFRREEAMENGEPTSVLYRPRRYALLKYDAGRGEMGVYCGEEREQKILLKVFGRALFGRDNFFPGTAKFDLKPLVRRGRGALAWGDVPPIEQVRLTDLEFFRRRAPWRRGIQQADDLFALIEQGELCWPQDVTEITRATFTVKFWRQSRARRVTIVPCNRALYSRDEDSPILERWMAARQIIQPASAQEAA
jgi:hypothetical protein